MLLLQLLLTSLLLPHFTLSAGVCYADRPGTCSGTNHFFQCIHDQSGCSSAPTSHKASVLPVSSWTGLDVCTNQDDTITGPCKMLRPKLATGDLNGDGLTDIVVASQLGGSDYSNIRTQYEILLLVNTGVPGTPSFTTVLRDATTPHVDPFKDIRDGQVRISRCSRCMLGYGTLLNSSLLLLSFSFSRVTVGATVGPVAKTTFAKICLTIENGTEVLAV